MSTRLLTRFREGLDGLRRAAPVPLSARHVTESAAIRTWCPVRREATGNGMCRYVSCGDCAYLAHATKDVRENLRWCCDACARNGKGVGYWKDGRCDMCGNESIVLALVRV